MKRLAFNIETAVDQAKLDRMPEPKVLLGNLKDPAKIAEKIEEAKQKQAERAALDPHFGRVICVTVAERDGMNGAPCDTYIRQDLGENDADDAERELLRWFWDRARNSKAFVSFNGSSFDVPFMLRRSLLLGIRPAPIPCGKYQVIQPGCEHLDLLNLLKDEWGFETSYSQNLSFFVREILGVEFPFADLDQSKLGEFLEAGEGQVIRDLCEWNTKHTLMLSEAVEHVYA